MDLLALDHQQRMRWELAEAVAGIRTSDLASALPYSPAVCRFRANFAAALPDLAIARELFRATYNYLQRSWV